MTKNIEENIADNQKASPCTVYRAPCTLASPSGEVELRSEEMQDILTRPPHILVRSGISVICLVLVILFGGSFFFKYPDILNGTIVITTENPPVWLVAKSSGKIKELNCTEHSMVRQGEVLAVIENPAVTTDVKRIKSLLIQSPISDSTFSFPHELLTSGYELGSIQNSFSTFVKSVTDYGNFLSLNTIQKEKEALRIQIADHRNYSDNLRKQLELKQEEIKIAQSVYEREKQLYNKGINSKADMENAENAWLNAQQSLQQLRTSIASDKMEMGQLQESLFQKDIQFQRDKNNLLSGLKTAYNELLAAVESWEQAFLLISPMEGTVTFNAVWTNHQFVTAGDKVLAVIPNQSGALVGKIQSPAELSGQAEIITDDRSLFERILSPLQYLLKAHTK